MIDGIVIMVTILIDGALIYLHYILIYRMKTYE